MSSLFSRSTFRSWLHDIDFHHEKEGESVWDILREKEKKKTKAEPIVKKNPLLWLIFFFCHPTDFFKSKFFASSSHLARPFLL